MPGTGRKSVPPFDRLMRRVDKRADGCWQFTGALTRDGYSQVRLGTGKPCALGHRVTYEALKRLRTAVDELLESSGLDDDEQAEWLERMGIDDDESETSS